MLRSLLVPVLLCVAGCVAEDECARRRELAAREATRDAAACRWEPEQLAEPDCDRLDRRAELTYVGVFCAAADLPGCIEPDETVWLACFGGATDGVALATDPVSVEP